MEPPNADTVLVRHGELGTKSSRVQSRMESQLAANLRSMLSMRGIEGTVERERGRIYVYSTPASVDAATDAATDTFGVISASPAQTVAPTRSAIEAGLVEIADVAYDSGSFAVRARRAGNRTDHPFTSKEIETEGGSAIWTHVEDRFAPAVDLDDPDVTFYVECRPETAFVFLEKRPGPGGFPVGTQGRVVALISGGTDSPVAAWELLGRGCEVIPVYFDFEAYGGPDHVARALSGIETVQRYAPRHPHDVWRVPIGDVANMLVEDFSRMRMILLRRFMFRVAEHIAREVDAHALVTGESLGQKSSQTGWNLSTTSAATELPIHRPLLNVDKQSIIAQAKEIGTYSDARINAGCNRIAPKHPATAARHAEVEAIEPPLLTEELDRFVERAECIDVFQDRTPKPPVAIDER